MPAPVIETTSLTRSFAGRRALDAVSLALEAGDCLALFGPNGAGKTTLLRVLAGLLKPTAGAARVAGVALPGGAAARAAVGLISHHSLLYDALTVRENVLFAARLYGVPDAGAATDAALARLRIAERADWPVRSLSRGLQQRTSIARALVHRPRVVLLDEPYTGLDEAGAAALTDALVALRAEGATMVLVTHHLGEGLTLATRVAVMRAGRLVRDVARDAVDPQTFGTEYRELARAG